MWRAGAKVPLLGDPLTTVRGITTATDTLVRITVPTALQAGDLLDPSKLRPRPAVISLPVLLSARQPLSSALASAVAVEHNVQALPAVGYLGAVAHARDQLIAQVERLTSVLRGANDAARVLPPMLGDSGRRRYFIGFQTNAEARGTGGLVGAYAIVSADHGRLHIDRVSTDSDLRITKPLHVDLGGAYDAVFGGYASTEFWGNTNVSPEFPDVARIWRAAYAASFPHERLDGFIATDPIALGNVLRAIGPVTLPDGEQVTADNVAHLLEVDVYARFGNDPARKTFQLQVARAVLEQMLRRRADPKALIEALEQSAHEQRVLVADTDVSIEATLRETELGGDLEHLVGPLAYLVVNNGGGNKLDYYLQRRLDYTAGGCSGATRTSTVRITLTNTAPQRGLPAVVTQRIDLPPGTAYRPGANKSLILLYVTDGAVYQGGTIDGRPLLMSAQESYGHVVLGTAVTVQPGQTRTLLVRLAEPLIGGPARILVQPLATTMPIRAEVPDCRTPKS